MIRILGGGAMAKLMSKSELIQKIVAQHSNKMARKDVKAVIESLAAIGYKELNKSGAFVLPGFAKFVVIKKPATKERSGINPFTKEPMIFKAKPARKVVRARPVKAVKSAVMEHRYVGAAGAWGIALILFNDWRMVWPRKRADGPRNPGPGLKWRS